MASPGVQDQTVTDKLVSLVLREAAMAAAQRSFQKTRVQDEVALASAIKGGEQSSRD